MDKRERAELFRERLSDAIRSRDMNRSDLARGARLDRSTVSQLLSEDAPRLPNGQALAAIATALGVSADWLLGLSTHRGAAAEILDQAVQIAETDRHPVDEHLLAWYRDAVGAKIRHVPANLPDVLKTEAVLWSQSLCCFRGDGSSLFPATSLYGALPCCADQCLDNRFSDP